MLVEAPPLVRGLAETIGAPSTGSGRRWPLRASERRLPVDLAHRPRQPSRHLLRAHEQAAQQRIGIAHIDALHRALGRV